MPDAGGVYLGRFVSGGAAGGWRCGGCASGVDALCAGCCGCLYPGMLSSCVLADRAEGLEAGAVGWPYRPDLVYRDSGVWHAADIGPDWCYYHGGYHALYGGFWLVDSEGKDDLGQGPFYSAGYHWCALYRVQSGEFPGECAGGLLSLCSCLDLGADGGFFEAVRSLFAYCADLLWHTGGYSMSGAIFYLVAGL